MISWELIHLISTAFMVGVIWYVQLVHYPMFNEYDTSRFSMIHNRHQVLTTFVVGPMMLLEVISGCMIFEAELFAIEPLWLTSAILLLLIWLSTAFLQMPCHYKLEKKYSSKSLTFLVRSNWIRTISWTLRLVFLAILNERGI
ncbi:MAG TPA: hypothetical protein DEP12_04245 [Planctomycetaceae bacterium]|nr:hypothetical protein [Planctomycetaceae bacterium]|tara:strand:- start:10140 stop:10568 length:429 start_codon:yes stop_codon:yes gene_type:complete